MFEDEEQTICFCHAVQLKTILEAIKNGSVTLEQIKENTCASTGCGGCEPEVIEILEKFAKPK
jgi:bacterioferritin-associated ferredoxin